MDGDPVLEPESPARSAPPFLLSLPVDVRSGNLQLCLVPLSHTAQCEPGTSRPRLLHRLLRSCHLDGPRRNPSKQVRQQNPAHHWMGDEHPCPYPVLLFTKLVGRYSRADRPSIVSLQRARDERVHQRTGRSETYVVSVWSRLLRIPTGSSPLPRRRKPTANLVEYPGSILVHISSLDRFYHHPLPTKASATEGSGFEGSIVGATKVFTRADDSCIPVRRSSCSELCRIFSALEHERGEIKGWPVRILLDLRTARTRGRLIHWWVPLRQQPHKRPYHHICPLRPPSFASRISY